MSKDGNGPGVVDALSEPSVTWSVAIFSARESADVLSACINSVIEAVQGTSAVVDVLINGNKNLAEQVAAAQSGWHDLQSTVTLRLWHVEVADKANAWNAYLRRIWIGSTTVFFVDGYVRLHKDALERLHGALAANAHALAASGVPTMGRSSDRLRRQMLDRGGIHGNLYALRGETMRALRERDFRLPIGLYRTDPLLGAVVAFGLDPTVHRWDRSRIVVEPRASWDYRPLDWWRPSHVSAHVKRRLRQGQGDLENAATRRWLSVDRRRPEELPRTIRELILQWMHAHPREARAVFRRSPLSYLAARKLTRASGPREGEASFSLFREWVRRREFEPSRASHRTSAVT